MDWHRLRAMGSLNVQSNLGAGHFRYMCRAYVEEILVPRFIGRGWIRIFLTKEWLNWKSAVEHLGDGQLLQEVC